MRSTSAPRRTTRQMLEDLAPPPPPCFTGRMQWLAYLEAAADESRERRLGPLDLRSGAPKFNREFDYCEDCTAKHALAMQREDRCKPKWLLVITEIAAA